MKILYLILIIIAALAAVGVIVTLCLGLYTAALLTAPVLIVPITLIFADRALASYAEKKRAGK